MKKKLLAIAVLLILCLAVSAPVCAADAYRIVDSAYLLSDQECVELNEKLTEISERLQFDVVIRTVESLNGEDPEQASCDIYDNDGYGYGENHDGVILLINMEERDWVITSTGYGQTAINEAARDYISESFLDDLSAGYYYDAFNTFADCCDEVVTQAQNGDVYKEPFPLFKNILIALGIGLVLGLIVALSLKGQLKSVKQENAAANYVVNGSLNIQVANEMFLYNTITRTEKPKSSSSSGGHSSSSGKF